MLPGHPNGRPQRAAAARRLRPLTAAGWSALVPGAGQWLAARRRRGAVFLAVAVLSVAGLGTVAWAAWSGSAPDLLGRVLSREGIAMLLAVNALVALFRLAAALDAWGLARRRGGRAGPAQVVGLVAVLSILVVAPHALAGVVGYEAGRLVGAVFAESPAPEPVPEPAPERVLEAEPLPDEAEAAENALDDAPVPPLESSEDVAGPALERDPYPAGIRDRERITVLMLGSDAGPGRRGTRVDAMVVGSVDVRTGEVVLISVPRNLADVPMPEGALADRLGSAYPQRLMSLSPEAAADPVLASEFTDPGKAAHVGAVEALLGLEIDHVAMVDMSGFVDVIDAFGGVEVRVSDPIRVRLSPPRADADWRTYDIPAGPQHLDGLEAHAYVRSRVGSDDYDRMRRQRCLVGSVAEQVTTVSLLRALPHLTRVLVDRVETDIPVDLLPDLARLAGRVDVSEMRTLGITPPTYTRGRNVHGFFSADVPRIRDAVGELLEGGNGQPAGVADLTGTCG